MKKTSLPTSNAKTAYGLLSEVRRLILAEPKRYNQNVYVARTPSTDATPLGLPGCGTVACVAGWVATLKHPRKLRRDRVGQIAAEILGIDTAQADTLFDGDALAPHSYNEALNPQTKEYALLGADHIAKFQREYAAQLKAKRV